MTFDIERARRLAHSGQDTGKLARKLEAACDEITALRDALLKARNYAQSSAHISDRALKGDTHSE